MNSVLKFMTGIVMGYHVDNQYYIHTKEQYYKLHKDGDTLQDVRRLSSPPTDAELSDAVFTFRDLPFGCSHKEILAVMGKPRLVDEEDLFGSYYSTLFWREKTSHGLSGSRAVIQIHLLNDAFLHASYTFPNPGTKGKTAIKTALYKKYRDGVRPTQSERCSLVDQEGHWISLHPSGSGVKIRYVSGDATMWRTLINLKARKRREAGAGSRNPVEELTEIL